MIGSESLATLGAWKDIHASFGRSVVLSLDFEGESLRGEGALLADPSFASDACSPARIATETQAVCLAREHLNREWPDIAWGALQPRATEQRGSLPGARPHGSVIE